VLSGQEHIRRCATDKDKGEGAVCCKGSVMSISSCGVWGGVTITATMENYRPILKHEKEMHRLRHEPQMYEYVPLPGLDRLLKGETGIQPEAKVSAWRLLLLGLLSLIIGDDFDIEGGGKIRTPQSEIGKILRSEASA
jgi:hypothetical protein